MYEVGDKVTIDPKDSVFKGLMTGVVVDWYYDDGNVWVIKMDEDGRIADYYDGNLSPI